MKIKIILSIIIFMSLVCAVILPSSWNFCLPNGCVFASTNDCSMSSCFNENVFSHINERAVFLNVIFNNIIFLSFLAIAIFLFSLYKMLNEFFNINQLVKYKLYENCNTLLNNLFVVIFSKGILHPKNF